MNVACELVDGPRLDVAQSQYSDGPRNDKKEEEEEEHKADLMRRNTCAKRGETTVVLFRNRFSFSGEC